MSAPDSLETYHTPSQEEVAAALGGAAMEGVVLHPVEYVPADDPKPQPPVPLTGHEQKLARRQRFEDELSERRQDAVRSAVIERARNDEEERRWGFLGDPVVALAFRMGVEERYANDLGRTRADTRGHFIGMGIMTPNGPDIHAVADLLGITDEQWRRQLASADPNMDPKDKVEFVPAARLRQFNAYLRDPKLYERVMTNYGDRIKEIKPMKVEIMHDLYQKMDVDALDNAVRTAPDQEKLSLITRYMLPKVDAQEERLRAGGLSDEEAEEARAAIEDVEARLGEFGIRRMPTVGRRYDGRAHELASISGDGPSWIIAEEILAGYQNGNRGVIRKARVNVVKQEAPAPDEDEDEDDGRSARPRRGGKRPSPRPRHARHAAPDEDEPATPETPSTPETSAAHEAPTTPEEPAHEAAENPEPADPGADEEAERAQRADEARRTAEQVHDAEALLEEIVGRYGNRASFHLDEKRGFSDHTGTEYDSARMKGTEFWRAHTLRHLREVLAPRPERAVDVPVEVVAFTPATEKTYRTETRRPARPARLFGLRKEEPAVTVQVEDSERPVRAVNPETGQTEEMVNVDYTFNPRETSNRLPDMPNFKETGGLRNGNMTEVRVQVPASVAKRLRQQVAKDPDTIRSLVDRLVMHNYTDPSRLDEDTWYEYKESEFKGQTIESGRARPPYERLPDGWQLHILEPVRPGGKPLTDDPAYPELQRLQHTAVAAPAQRPRA